MSGSDVDDPRAPGARTPAGSDSTVAMSRLQRPDVWLTGDLGVRRGDGLGWGLDEMPTPGELADTCDPT